jgi:hypothetical protein
MHGFADGIGYGMVFKNKIGYEIEKGCPDYCLERREYLGGNDGGDGIGSVVKAVDVIKNQGKRYDNYQKCHEKKINVPISLLHNCAISTLLMHT